uniref:Uncharacterized protein n=1 Tax=Anopheles triannulatus TaxID=58253 RepID=A0A2M4AT81_9DIPT
MPWRLSHSFMMRSLLFVTLIGIGWCPRATAIVVGWKRRSSHPSSRWLPLKHLTSGSRVHKLLILLLLLLQLLLLLLLLCAVLSVLGVELLLLLLLLKSRKGLLLLGLLLLLQIVKSTLMMIAMHTSD